MVMRQVEVMELRGGRVYAVVLSLAQVRGED
jgi:hypothetical protein